MSKKEIEERVVRTTAFPKPFGDGIKQYTEHDFYLRTMLGIDQTIADLQIIRKAKGDHSRKKQRDDAFESIFLTRSVVSSYLRAYFDATSVDSKDRSKVRSNNAELLLFGTDANPTLSRLREELEGDE